MRGVQLGGLRLYSALPISFSHQCNWCLGQHRGIDHGRKPPATIPTKPQMVFAEHPQAGGKKKYKAIGKDDDASKGGPWKKFKGKGGGKGKGGKGKGGGKGRGGKGGWNWM